MTQNSAYDFNFPWACGFTIANPSFPAINSGNIGSGDTDVYVVPANRRAWVGSLKVFNGSGGSINWHPEIKVSSSYYQITALSSTGNNSTVNLLGGSSGSSIILEAAESLSVNAASLGLNVFGNIVEFDVPISSAAGFPVIYSPKVVNLSSGNNTIYTVPSNKTASMMNAGATFGKGLGSNVGFNVFNGSSTTRTYTIYVVPNGGSASSGNEIFTGTVLSGNEIQVDIFPPSMNSGDFIVVNTDSAPDGTQTAWISVMEI